MKPLAAVGIIFLKGGVFCTGLAACFAARLDGIVSSAAICPTDPGPALIPIHELKNNHNGLVLLPLYIT